jgi:hypothetical protein
MCAEGQCGGEGKGGTTKIGWEKKKEGSRQKNLETPLLEREREGERERQRDKQVVPSVVSVLYLTPSDVHARAAQLFS